MRLLDRYVLVEFVKLLLLSLFAFVVIFAIVDLFEKIQDFMDGHASALVVGSDGKVAARKLQLAGTHGDRWIVESGLEDGDRVIVGGAQRVQPGAAVQVAQTN